MVRKLALALARGRRVRGALALALMLLLAGCPSAHKNRPPTAHTFEQRLDAYLMEAQVGERSLGPYLAQVEIEGCMETDEGPLLDALRGMRRLYRQTYERLDAPGRLMVRDAWARTIKTFSPDGQALVETYLDHPPLGRAFYFCDDGLPVAWQTLEAADYVDRARAFADGEIESRMAVVEGGGADGAAAVEQLRTMQADVLRRFRAQFDEGGEDAEAYASLEAALEAAWMDKVDEHDLGRPVGPRAQPHISEGYLAAEAVEWGEAATYSDHPYAANAGATEAALSQGKPYVPGMVGIPNARDIAARDRARESWKKTRRLMLKEARQEAKQVLELERQLAETADPEEQAALLRELQRTENRLDHLAADYGLHIERVKTTRTGLAVADRLLVRAGRKEVKRTWRKRDGVQEAQETARDAVARAGDELGLDAAADAVSVDAAGAGGEGTGLPDEITGGEAAGGTPWTVSEPPEGDGNTLVYRGPCPPPDPGWSADVVAALTARYPELDGTDVRIFLGLLARTFPQIGGRAEIEAVVLQHVERNLDLRLRAGRADELSEIYDATRPGMEQDEITFYLTLDL